MSSANMETLCATSPYDGILSSGSNDSDRPQRKRHKKQETNSLMVCAVCGAEAHGYNFNVVSCDSCKVFFRRTASNMNMGDAVEKLLGKCVNEGKCDVSKETRKRCASCRMRRCLEAGMKLEWLTPLHRLQMRANFSSRKERPPRDAFKRQYSLDNQLSVWKTEDADIDEELKTKPVQAERHYTTSDEPTRTIPIRVQLVPAGTPSSESITFDDHFSELFTRHIFQECKDQVEEIQRDLMEPLTEDEVERYNLLDKNPATMETAYNRREIGVRRVVRAFLALPQFALLNKAAQVAIMKDTMRGVSTFFFLLRYKLDIQVACFEYITREAQLNEWQLNCQEALLQGLCTLTSKQWATLLSIFTPPSNVGTISTQQFPDLVDAASLQDFLESCPISNSWSDEDLLGDSDYNITPTLQLPFSNFVKAESMPTDVQLQPLAYEETVKKLAEHLNQSLLRMCQCAKYDRTLLTAACLLRLFSVHEASSRLSLSMADRFIIQKTRSDLHWFFEQYGKQLDDGEMLPQMPVMSAAAYAPKGVVDPIGLFEELDKIERLKLHLEYFMHRENVTPLMREFLPAGGDAAGST